MYRYIVIEVGGFFYPQELVNGTYISFVDKSFNNSVVSFLRLEHAVGYIHNRALRLKKEPRVVWEGYKNE